MRWGPHCEGHRRAAVGHLGDILRVQPHHHRSRDRWHGVPRRRRSRRPLPAAAPLGSALGGSAFRDQEGEGAAVLLVDRGGARVRQPLHFRRGRDGTSKPSEFSAAFGLVQLEKLHDNLGGPETELRPTAAPTFGQRPDVFILPRDHCRSTRPGTCSRCMIRPNRGCGDPNSSGIWSATASTPGWCGRETSPASRHSPPCAASSPRRRSAQCGSRDGTGLSSVRTMP